MIWTSNPTFAPARAGRGSPSHRTGDLTMFERPWIDAERESWDREARTYGPDDEDDEDDPEDTPLVPVEPFDDRR